jgi:hypothetical protein
MDCNWQLKKYLKDRKMITTQLTLNNFVLAAAVAISLTAGTSALAVEMGGIAASTKAAPTPAAAAKDERVKKAGSQEIGQRRQTLNKEAILARDEIFHAIFYLDKKEDKEAFKMLEKAEGQLSLLLARDPKLKFAAIGVRASIFDLEDSPDTIHKVVNEARSALDKGQIQTARTILSPMTSEMRIYTDYLPLEIYPEAIKRASTAIQETKPIVAEAILADALGSIVTDEDVIPLPPLKAEGDVLEAEELYKNDKAKNKDKVLSLLNSADVHLANANALGYGEYREIRDEIASLKSKQDLTKPDLFDKIKDLFRYKTYGKKS